MASFPSRAEGSTQRLGTRPRWDFQLIIREQPVHSRMCGVGERVDRRPIDPPPIVQLKILGQDDMDMMNSLQAVSPYIFLAAVLVPGDVQDDATEQLLQIDYHRKLTIGRTVSSLYLLRDIDNTEGAFFAFSDISVRADGRYRLRMCLFEMLDSGVQYRQSVLSDVFTVYSAKKFPGMHLSCPLACHFAEQGLKIRIRKESRKRSTGTRWNFETASDGGCEADTAHPDNDTQKRHSIASVTSGEFSGYSSESVVVEAVSRNTERIGDNLYPFMDDSEDIAGPSSSKLVRFGALVGSQGSAAIEHTPKKHLPSVMYSTSVGLHGPPSPSPSPGDLSRHLQINQSGVISRTGGKAIIDVISTTSQIATVDPPGHKQQLPAFQQPNAHTDSYLKLPPLQSFDGNTPRPVPISILEIGEQNRQQELPQFYRPPLKASYYDNQLSFSLPTPSSRGIQYPNTDLLPVERAAPIPTAQLEWRPDRPELVIQSSRSQSLFDQQSNTVLPPLREQLEKIGMRSSPTEDDNTDQGDRAAIHSER